jgi:prophage regulatory protein
MPRPDQLIRERECRRLTGLGRTCRWRMERAGTFPQRRAIVGRTSGYLLSEVASWIESRPISSYATPTAPLRARGLTPAAIPVTRTQRAARR